MLLPRTAPVALYYLLLVVLLSQYSACFARLQAAVILPHGDFAYDPWLVNDDPAQVAAAVHLAKASRHVGHEFLDQTVDPDVIFLITPHGIALSHDFGLYLGQHASGYADIGADVHQPNATLYRVHLPRIDLAPTLAIDLLDTLRGSNVTGIQTSADESQDMPLQWAEVIPLLLVKETKRRQHLIWSQPLRRFGPSAGTDMVDELLTLGQRLFAWMEAQPQHMAVLVSADLSHTHRADGPYGYSNASQPFDEAVGTWAGRNNPCDSKHTQALLQRARALQPHALSCGYTGMILLHGMLCGGARIPRTNNVVWNSRVLVNHNVTYYGMMVAMMQRNDETVAFAG